MSFDASIYNVFAKCPTDVLRKIAEKHPQHRPIIDTFIKVCEVPEKQKEIIDCVMTDLTGLCFPELIPVISAYTGIREPTTEERAMVKNKMQDMEGSSAIIDLMMDKEDFSDGVPADVGELISRLNHNIDTFAEGIGMHKSIWELVWTWEMVKDEFEKLCGMLEPHRILVEVSKCHNHNTDTAPDMRLRPKSNKYPPMPENLKEKRFELVCSRDEAVCEIEAKAAWEIGFIRNLLQEDVRPAGMFTKLEMPKWITSDNLKLVIQFCNQEVSRKRPRNDDGEPPLPPQMEIEESEIFDLHKIAEYLLIQSLLEWTSGLIADMIKGKSAEQIQSIINLDTGTVCKGSSSKGAAS